MTQSKHLIGAEELRELARPVSIHVEDGDVMAFISESEDLYIIPKIGYETFKRLTETDDNNLSDDDKTLLNGGEWTQTTDCGTTIKQYCKGLKTALAYFVNAKMVRADGGIVARAGFMQPQDDYARHYDDSKLKQYNDLMDIAENYLSSCLSFLNQKNGDGLQLRGSRCHIHAIGD